jgi:hypothetical protein
MLPDSIIAIKLRAELLTREVTGFDELFRKETDMVASLFANQLERIQLFECKWTEV